MNPINFVIAGVGGQGALLVSHIIAEVGISQGLEVKMSEVHGMSQRGGSVSSHVRWGCPVWSPVIGEGEADYLISLEKLEALRFAPMLRFGGVFVVGSSKIPPLTVSAGVDHYPTDVELQQLLTQFSQKVYFVPTTELAENLGNPRVHNIVLLGGLARLFPDVPPADWLAAISDRVPSTHTNINRSAFQAGLEVAL
jgi:indolepyruvate ferredoxin oxidoreductase beta subunit